ncbi:probable cyclin-dependent serine/threonine-protein kinase DDB_G0292550 isoform X1 [Pieris napi]|uniref:probable cyclin-dependent serine/threonine-protein kinase DDB_G0292550 isoform X1 n=1 Tax=Pieris napi TaxID=78633 RepID=UPI001FBBFC4C|nr:probable cyclin-dependent serine/threonine-protein kinase DDB_G0292550 isoform X1 [Pieris napi]
MNKLIRVTLLTIAVFHHADCKRTKSKKLTSDTEESTPQPSVLTYSNFGFNDVGPYDGFVPTSPDYATLLSNNKESSTRLYAPAFPTNLDSSGFSESYGSSPGQSLPSDEQLQTSMSKYQTSNLNYFTSPSFDNLNDPNKFISDSSIYEQSDSDSNSPIYGAKLNYPKQKSKIREYNPEYNVSRDEISNINADAYTRNQDTYIQSDNKQVHGDLNLNNYPPPYQSSFPKYTTTTVVPPEYENTNIKTPESASAIKFPRVIDFTNMNAYFSKNVNNNDNINTRYQNTPLDINQYSTNNDDKVFSNANNNFNNDFDKNAKPLPHLKYNGFNLNSDAQKNEKDIAKLNYLANQEFSQNYFNNKNKLKGKYSFSNDKLRKPWDYSNKDENGKKSPIRYEYTTNHTASSSKYGNPFKRPFNNSIDEISPASSNLDFYNYQHPDTEFGNIKTNPFLKSPFEDSDNHDFSIHFADKFKPLNEYQSSLKNSYTTPPTITSHWGNLFKPTEFSSHKTNFRKPVFQEEHDDIVHIPKRPSSGKYGTHLESNSFGDWAHRFKPHGYKNQYEWPKESNRYTSEEDLLDLRNHDLTHSSHPPFRPGFNDSPEDFDYKKLVDKWKQSYLKSKYKDSVREYETYASETKPIHVPVPKPYPIEVPHPVIVPVPQPYPVHVPVPKPVAIPVIREITVPIEKPVPYPVYKKVPYPVEKPVPVPVEKQVHVPIMKPYPVAVPQVRPLFHHTRPHDERDPDLEDDEEYQTRPESSKRIPNLKRPKNKRPPPRRPSRMTYHDRDRRRGPQRRPPSRDQRYRHTHSERRPYRHQDEYEEYEPEYLYCKRTGNC